MNGLTLGTLSQFVVLTYVFLRDSGQKPLAPILDKEPLEPVERCEDLGEELLDAKVHQQWYDGFFTGLVAAGVGTLVTTYGYHRLSVDCGCCCAQRRASRAVLASRPRVSTLLG